MTSMCVNTVDCDDPLQDFNWREKIKSSYDKPWMNYTHAFIWKRALNRLYQKKTLLEILYSMNSKLKVNALHRIQDFYNVNITYPIVTIKEQDLKYFTSGPNQYYISYTHKVKWDIFLYFSLRFQIIFKKLKIFSFFGTCNAELIINYALPNDNEATYNFCGVYSNMNVYPPSHKLNFVLFYNSYQSNFIHSIFTVMSDGVIHNSNINSSYQLGYSSFSIGTHHSVLGIINTSILSYHVLTSVLKYLVFKFKIELINEIAKFKLVLYDGPGYESEKFVPNTNKSIQKCSGFQCILQIYQKLLANKPLNCTLLFKSIYSTNNIKNITISNLTKMPVALSIQRGRQSSLLSIIKISSMIKTIHINISIDSLTYEGPDDGQACLFGGIIFYDTEVKKLSLCPQSIHDSYATSYAKNYYSLGRESIIAVFSFKQYSMVHCTLSIFYTKCKFVELKMCDSQPGVPFADIDSTVLNMTNVKCMVVQFIPRHATNCTNLNYKRYILIEKIMGSAKMYQYHITGYITGHFQAWYKYLSSRFPLTRFLVGGSDYIHNRASDIRVIEIHQNRNRSRQLSPQEIDKMYMIRGNRYVPDAHIHKWERFGVFNPFLAIKTFYPNSLLFNLKFLSWMPTHSDSLSFRYDFLGVKNWVELNISPFSGKNKGSAFNMSVGLILKPLFRIHINKTLIIKVEEIYNKSKSAIVKANIQTKVSNLYNSAYVCF